MTPDSAADLRARLLDLRRDALAQLAAALPVVDTGLLAIAANACTVLAALDAGCEHTATSYGSDIAWRG